MKLLHVVDTSAFSVLIREALLPVCPSLVRNFELPLRVRC